MNEFHNSLLTLSVVILTVVAPAQALVFILSFSLEVLITHRQGFSQASNGTQHNSKKVELSITYVFCCHYPEWHGTCPHHCVYPKFSIGSFANIKAGFLPSKTVKSGTQNKKVLLLLTTLTWL
jgi:hypothetical protein